MQPRRGALHHYGATVPARRLEDRIRILCSKALAAQHSELDAIFLELNSALHEHTKRLRKMAVRRLASGEPNQPPERRCA